MMRMMRMMRMITRLEQFVELEMAFVAQKRVNSGDFCMNLM